MKLKSNIILDYRETHGSMNNDDLESLSCNSLEMPSFLINGFTQYSNANSIIALIYS